MARIERGHLTPPSRLRADLSPQVDLLFARGLSPTREERYANIDELVEAFRAATKLPTWKYAAPGDRASQAPTVPPGPDDSSCNPPSRRQTQNPRDGAGASGRADHRYALARIPPLRTPRVPPRRTSSGHTPTMGSENGEPSVLIVDDDDDFRNVLAWTLEREGCCVSSAVNGERALEILDAGATPRFLLLDLWMPGTDGWQLRRELQGRTDLHDMHVIVMTGARGQSANALKVLRVLQKPFAIDVLLRLLRHPEHLGVWTPSSPSGRGGLRA